MKVRMLTTMAGPSGAAQPGQIVDLPPVQAQALIAGRFAEAIESTPPAPVETATLEAPEAAVTRRGRAPGRQG